MQASIDKKLLNDYNIKGIIFKEKTSWQFSKHSEQYVPKIILQSKRIFGKRRNNKAIMDFYSIKVR